MHRARKRFGQNFLHDPGVIRRIVDAVAPQPGETLIEIGPGLGAITRPLVQCGSRVIAIELDTDLAPGLREALSPLGSFRLIEGDALCVDFTELAEDGPIRVVGNLPYNISTPLLFHLLSQAVPIHDMHFMLQREVVERICAPSGGREYGRLSVMVQYRCAVQSLFEVGAGAFRPQPKVRSAVVRLTPHAAPVNEARIPGCLDLVVRAAFSQRRKKVRNSLAGLLDVSDIIAAGVDPANRAQNLDLVQYVALANVLAGRDGADSRGIREGM